MNNKLLSIFITGVSSVFLSATSVATTIEQNEYVWQFLHPDGWPDGYHRNIGKPKNLIWARDEYSDDFFQRINNALPERSLNEAFITDDTGSTISLSEQAEVFITFLHEGAGYRNSFGYFLFDPDNPPLTPSEVDEIIVFPNLSFPHMTNGHRLSIGTFPAGTHIGFFIAANGYWYATGVKPFKTPYYYSLQHLNPESNESLRQHTVLLYDEEVSEVIMGFEDLPRTWGDNDFNDAIFSVKSTPEVAINKTNLIVMPDENDSDADGVADESDQFPHNHQRAYSSYYPSANDWVTLAFEDNWPKLGDYDMNDLVVREQLQTIYNADGLISGFKLHGFIDARGASKHSGFALRLLSLSADMVEQASIEIDGQTYTKEAELYQTDAVIQLWRDTHVFTTTGETGKCSHFNTNVNCTVLAPVPFELDVHFSAPVTSLPHSDFDFFLFRTNNRAHEIHFAGYPPTDLFNVNQLGKHADTSDPQTNRYFKSDKHLPWALKIQSQWTYPREYIDILWAYPQYESWAESSGVTNPEWYNDNARKTHKFNREDQ